MDIYLSVIIILLIIIIVRMQKMSLYLEEAIIKAIDKNNGMRDIKRELNYYFPKLYFMYKEELLDYYEVLESQREEFDSLSRLGLDSYDESECIKANWDNYIEVISDVLEKNKNNKGISTLDYLRDESIKIEKESENNYVGKLTHRETRFMLWRAWSQLASQVEISKSMNTKEHYDTFFFLDIWELNK
jgi:hypothetical protein